MGHEKHRDIHACLTAWAVRRAGPERRSVGYLPHCGWAISSRKPFSTLAAFWDTGWAVGSLPEGNANKKCQHGVDWVLVFLTLGWAWHWALETGCMPLCQDVQCTKYCHQLREAWALLTVGLLGCSPLVVVPAVVPGGVLSRNWVLL